MTFKQVKGLIILV